MLNRGQPHKQDKMKENIKKTVFKNSAPFTDCITEIGNIQVDNLDIVIPMYNLIEYSDNYSGRAGSWWECHKDESKNLITNSNSFDFKARFLARTNNNGKNYKRRNSCSTFQGVNRPLVLSFKDNNDRTSQKGYFMHSVEIKYYNFMIDWQNVFDQPVKGNIRTCQGDDYTNGYLLFYPYFNEHYKII